MGLLALVALLAQSPGTELATEAALREALFGAGAPLARAEDPDWRARACALEQIERAARAGRAPVAADGTVARRALGDAHPSVRMRAWSTLGALGASAEVDVEELAAGLAEDLASVRLACAGALEFVRARDRARALAQLAFDPDERVRRVARNALVGCCAASGADAQTFAGFVARVAEEEDEAAFAHLAEACLRAGLEGEGLAALRRVAQGPVRGALGEALAFAAGAEGDAQRLVAGLAHEDQAFDPARSAVLAAAARAHSPALARALVPLLDTLAAESLARELAATLLVQSLPPGSAWDELARLGAPPALLAELVPRLASELERCDARLGSAWLTAVEELRPALVAAAATVFVRTREPESERLLVAALGLDGPALAGRAFAALASAAELRPESEDALRAAFRAQPGAARVRLLADFTRARPFPAMRDDWLALGAAQPVARAALSELLAALDPDASVGDALACWLGEDLAALGPAGAPARAHEQRVQGELRALARHAPARVEDFLRALGLALGRSSEIGKLAVAALGRSAEGCRELAAWLARGAFAAEADSRVRIEVGIQLATHADGEPRRAARELLLAERASAAWDLRARMLTALAEGADAEGLGLLVGRLEAPEGDGLERAFLTTLLAGRFGEGAAPALSRVLATSRDLEVLRCVLAAFEAWPTRVSELRAWLAHLEQDRRFTPDERVLLAGEAREALAAAEPADAELARRWLAVALARAPADLAARQAGRELPAVEFVGRSELEIARRLAHAGTLSAALQASGSWWQIDGRLLGELGRAALEGEAESATVLTRAAIVARLGEHEPDARELALLAARLAALAARRGDEGELARLLPRLLSARRAGILSEADAADLAQALAPGAAEPDSALRAFAARYVPAPRDF